MSEHDLTTRLSWTGTPVFQRPNEPHDDDDRANIQETTKQSPSRIRVSHLRQSQTTKDCSNFDISHSQGVVAVATATSLLAPTLSLHLLHGDTCDPVFDTTTLPTSDSVDRSSSPIMTVRKHRSLKSSRRNIVIGLDYNDTKTTSLNISNDDHDLFISNDPHSGPFAPISQTVRTIRRTKRLNPSLRRSTSTPRRSVKPIAISLTFSSKSAPHTISTTVSSSALRDTEIAVSEKDSESQHQVDAPFLGNPAENSPQPHGLPDIPALPPLSIRPHTPVSVVSTSSQPSPTVSVRLGHPSRPYYSAIRKQGISPTSSKRSSIKDPMVSPSRPKSAPSPLSTKSEPGSQRHFSLSAVPHTSSTSPISVFSLEDDLDDNDEELPMIPLTPLSPTGTMSFATSLASAAKSLNRKRSTSGPATFSAINWKSSRSLPPSPLMSISTSSIPAHMKGKGFRVSSPTSSGTSPIGFSVSGETELKMALAFSEAKSSMDSGSRVSLFPTTTSVIREGTPSHPLPPQLFMSNPHVATLSHPRNSIANRVKKLRQGLKDMFFTTTHVAGNNTNSTNTTTTTTTT